MYLSEPDDMRLTKELIRRNVDILLSGPFNDICLTDVQLNSNDEVEIETYIRRQGTTIWHPTSTCRMGMDEQAVVTPDLRVRGIERLRVCDASVMPSIVSGNTNAPVIMMAEKGADIIRGAKPV